MSLVGRGVVVTMACGLLAKPQTEHRLIPGFRVAPGREFVGP